MESGDRSVGGAVFVLRERGAHCDVLLRERVVLHGEPPRELAFQVER